MKHQTGPKATCEKKSAAFAERKALRTEEIEALVEHLAEPKKPLFALGKGHHVPGAHALENGPGVSRRG